MDICGVLFKELNELKPESSPREHVKDRNVFGFYHLIFGMTGHINSNIFYSVVL